MPAAAASFLGRSMTRAALLLLLPQLAATAVGDAVHLLQVAHEVAAGPAQPVLTPATIPEPWGVPMLPADLAIVAAGARGGGGGGAAGGATARDDEDSMELDSMGAATPAPAVVAAVPPADGGDAVLDGVATPDGSGGGGGSGGAALPELAVCVEPSELESALRNATDNIIAVGLLPWSNLTLAAPLAPPVIEAGTPDQAAAGVQDLRLAFLLQVSSESKLYLVRRTFTRLYTATDIFLYLVDSHRLHPGRLRAVLPDPLPSNVVVNASAAPRAAPPGAAGAFWPRVQVLLEGLEALLKQYQWDFAIRLFESDYPVHSLSWIRQTLALDRQASVLEIAPRCVQNALLEEVRDEWQPWSHNATVASCGAASGPTLVPGVQFPTDELETHGFKFARGSENLVLTRELAAYALGPGAAPLRRLLALHPAPEEAFWATLVLNIPGFNQSVGPQHWFARWPSTGAAEKPETLTELDEEALLADRPLSLFMREVDLEQSRRLLDDVDALSMQERQGPEPWRAPVDWAWDRHALPCKSPEPSDGVAGRLEA